LQKRFFKSLRNFDPQKIYSPKLIALFVCNNIRNIVPISLKFAMRSGVIVSTGNQYGCPIAKMEKGETKEENVMFKTTAVLVK
jgi:hypothetical protein